MGLKNHRPVPSHTSAMQAVQNRLNQVGEMPATSAVAGWEEISALNTLGDDIETGFRQHEGGPADYIGHCIEIAASAIRLASYLSRKARAGVK